MYVTNIRLPLSLHFELELFECFLHDIKFLHDIFGPKKTSILSKGDDLLFLGRGLLILCLHQNQDYPGRLFTRGKEQGLKDANTLAEHIHSFVACLIDCDGPEIIIKCLNY